MSQQTKIAVELRVNNGVFICGLENKIYSTEKQTVFAVTKVEGIQQVPPQGIIPMIGAMLICEDCWKNNSEGKGLDFKEPSNIVIPTNPNTILKGMKKN